LILEKDEPGLYKAQRILLCTWIIELKLNDISKITTMVECKDKDDPTKEATQDTLNIE